MVQANSKRLENIEKFLEALDCKIESFLSGESTRETPRKKDHVQDSFRKTEVGHWTRLIDWLCLGNCTGFIYE